MPLNNDWPLNANVANSAKNCLLLIYSCSYFWICFIDVIKWAKGTVCSESLLRCVFYPGKEWRCIVWFRHLPFATVSMWVGLVHLAVERSTQKGRVLTEQVWDNWQQQQEENHFITNMTNRAKATPLGLTQHTKNIPIECFFYIDLPKMHHFSSISCIVFSILSILSFLTIPFKMKLLSTFKIKFSNKLLTWLFYWKPVCFMVFYCYQTSLCSL